MSNSINSQPTDSQPTSSQPNASSSTERLPGVVVPLVLVIAGFAASCALASGPPQPEIEQSVSCTLHSGRTVRGEVRDTRPGAVLIDAVWIDWDRVEAWHPHESDPTAR